MPSLVPVWETTLLDRLGYQQAADLEASPWWPHLANTLNHATTNGRDLPEILTPGIDPAGFDDPCHALLWRATLLTEDAPCEEPEPPHPDHQPPDDIQPTTGPSLLIRALDDAARLRDRTEADFTDLELRQAFASADRWTDTPHTPERLTAAIEAATTYYETQLPGSWSQDYLTQRLGHDLTGDPRYRPGHAPAGWTTLVSHLRQHGFTTDELLTTGLATRTRHGTIIDRFRDRAILPITHHGHIVGFVARRHPDTNDTHGPKYLNSPNTALFTKRDTLYGHHLLTPASVPVIVEGPMDAIAVTLAGHGTYIGVAPLGTALTPEQTLLLRHTPTPIIGTDNDPAGNTAAEHAFWLLAQHRFDPHRLHLPTGTDPAQFFEQHGPEALHDALTNATVPQAQRMICERTTFLDPIEAGRQIAEIIAARPTANWSNTLRLSRGEQTRYLLARVNAWTTAPTTAADHAKEQTRAMRRRVDQPPAERWRRWADTTGITGTPEWPQIATLLDELHYAGADTRILARDLAKTPAQVIAATLVRHQTGQAGVVDWRPWAEIVNPTLLADEGWADIQADLTRLQAAGTDLKSLASAMAGRDPARVAVGLRNVLRHHSAQTDHEMSEPTAMMAVKARRAVDRQASRSV